MPQYTPLPDKRIKDIRGQRFGRLTVIEYSHSHQGAYWKCLCDCGTEKIIKGKSLVSGHTIGCGCVNRDRMKTGTHRTHNLSSAREYNCYNAMKSRCYYPGATHYKDYGGRGITVCDRWLASFEDFYADVGPCPSPRHSLHRIDNDGPYSPENCRWATDTEQANNKRNNHELTFNGETHTLAEWEGKTGIQSSTIRKRLRMGWSVSEALTRPIRPIKGVHC